MPLAGSPARKVRRQKPPQVEADLSQPTRVDRRRLHESVPLPPSADACWPRAMPGFSPSQAADSEDRADLARPRAPTCAPGAKRDQARRTALPSLDVGGGVGLWLNRFALLSAGAAVALYGVLQAVDGVGFEAGRERLASATTVTRRCVSLPPVNGSR
jgi:hypothetical protein